MNESAVPGGESTRRYLWLVAVHQRALLREPGYSFEAFVANQIRWGIWFAREPFRRPGCGGTSVGRVVG